MSGLLAGTVYLAIDGRQYMVAGKARFSLSGTTREAVMGQHPAYQGYSEKRAPGSITALLRDSPDLDLQSLQGMTGVNVYLELANGKTVSGGEMFVEDAFEVDTEDGTFEVKFTGFRVEEIHSGA
jgi:hypothetical protein